MVLYQWRRREQALHEEINLQMCRTFMHFTSISNNGMVHINLLLMKPKLNSSISSFNCPLPQPVFYSCLLVMLVVTWFCLITPKLCQKSICVFIRNHRAKGKWWNNQRNFGLLCKEILDQGTWNQSRIHNTLTTHTRTFLLTFATTTVQTTSNDLEVRHFPADKIS